MEKLAKYSHIAGVVSLVVGALQLILILLSALDVVYFLPLTLFLFLSYKTLKKKENLKTWQKVLFALFLLFSIVDLFEALVFLFI